MSQGIHWFQSRSVLIFYQKTKYQQTTDIEMIKYLETFQLCKQYQMKIRASSTLHQLEIAQDLVLQKWL